MVRVNKIDSNATGLRFCEEASLKILPTTVAHQVWYPLEPNEYSDFGGQITTVARNPINPSRQRKKGTVTDLDASCGFQLDLTQENSQRLLRGFMFAQFREKADTRGFNKERTFNSDGTEDTAPTNIPITSVTGTGETYDAASGLTIFEIGDLIWARDFTNSANNGLKRATAVTATTVTVAEDIVDEAAPPTTARLNAVGFQFAAGDLDVDASSGFAKLTTTIKDLTELGIIPGEWIFVGGDSAATKFPTNAVNNGLKRVRSVTANEIVIDKSDSDMITEASTTETIQVFIMSRLIKNESDPDLIKRYPYQFERTLGANDDADLTLQQSEYILGSIANQLTINISTASKVTVDLVFVGMDNTTIDENVTGADTIKSSVSGAVAPDIVEADPFNTSSDITRFSMAKVTDGDEAPEDLFAFIQEMTLSIDNGATPDKAVGVIGAFDVSMGTFTVDANATAYFADVAAIQTVRDNDDITMDMHLVKQNMGVSFDLPLISVGDAKPNVAQDEAITIPLTNAAASGAKIVTTLNHTLLIGFFDYLPDAAE